MRSYRGAVAQDADFADGIPEANAWLGFSTRRNPLFLPPKGAEPSPEIGLHGTDDLARLRDAQDFALSSLSRGAAKASGARDTSAGGRGGSGDDGCIGAHPNESTGKVGSSGPRTLSERIRVMNSQLAATQETIRDLEVSLRSLEDEREKSRSKAARSREAAAEAGNKKLAKRMYRLRGIAAFLEDSLEGLNGEITAVRVRLFAERLVGGCGYGCAICSYAHGFRKHDVAGMGAVANVSPTRCFESTRFTEGCVCLFVSSTHLALQQLLVCRQAPHLRFVTMPWRWRR